VPGLLVEQVGTQLNTFWYCVA